MNLVGGSGAGRHPKKGMKKKSKKKVHHAGPSQTGKRRDDKNKAECFYCRKLGHWKRNCPQYIATLDPNRPRKKKQQGVAGQGTYVITPCSFSICDTTNWVLDTGSPYHICNSMQGLQVSRRFDEGERFLNVGDGSKVPVLALGIMSLVINSRNVILSECHYCPSFLLNIISVGLLAMYGYNFLIKKNIYNIILNDVTIFVGQLNNRIYLLS